MPGGTTSTWRTPARTFSPGGDSFTPEGRAGCPNGAPARGADGWTAGGTAGTAGTAGWLGGREGPPSGLDDRFLETGVAPRGSAPQLGHLSVPAGTYSSQLGQTVPSWPR